MLTLWTKSSTTCGGANTDFENWASADWWWQELWILKSLAFGTGPWGSIGQLCGDREAVFPQRASPPSSPCKDLSQAAGHSGVVLIAIPTPRLGYRAHSTLSTEALISEIPAELSITSFCLVCLSLKSQWALAFSWYNHASLLSHSVHLASLVP